MPDLSIPLNALLIFLTDVLIAGGFSSKNAQIIAEHLIDAEMKGVVSHGVNRLGLYINEVDRGVIDPTAEPTISTVRESLLSVNGQRGIGIVAMSAATDAAIDVASNNGIAAVGVINCGHTGRMGAYGEQAANAGFFSLSLGGGGRRLWGNVVPHGGKDPVMSTNPYTLALPGLVDDPVVCDFAISTWPAGKVAVARANGDTLPPDVIINKYGKPSSNPEDFYDGGALLPAAGPKGSGMGIIAELMGDAMLGQSLEYNWLMILIRVDAFRTLSEYQKASEVFIAEVRDSTPLDGVEKVIMPGQKETELGQKGLIRGVEISEGVWNGIKEAANSVGINTSSYFEVSH